MPSHWRTKADNSPQRPIIFDTLQLLRFVTLTLITAPPNSHWQQFLERSFPAYPSGVPQQRVQDIESRPAEDAPELKEGYEERMKQITKEGESKFSLKNTLTKWFVDCITAGAIMNTVAFFVIMGLLKGQGSSQIGTNIRTVSFLRVLYSLWLTLVLIWSANHSSYCSWLQDLAHRFHHQLQLHPRPQPNCVFEFYRSALGDLHELGSC